MACVLKSAFVLSSVAVLASAGPQTDKGWDLRTTSMDGPVSRVCFPMKAPAHGSYFLAGPAKFESSPEGEWKFKGVFDGLGMVNHFELRPKDNPTKMCYTSAWMNTGTYKDYLKNPKEPPRGVLFEETEPPRKSCFMHMCDYTAPNDNNWVNMFPIGDQLVWFSDTPTMVTMDPKTLNCTGLKQWGDSVSSMGMVHPTWIHEGHMAAGGSAHPLFKPGTQTLVEIMIESPLVLGKHYVDIYTFDATKQGKQNRTRVASVEANNAQYFHSFGLTPNYVVLPFNLKTTNIGPGHPPLIMDSFQESWEGIHVVDSDGKVQIFDDMEKFFHVHIANTFENASGITMDFGSYDAIIFDRMPVLDIQQDRNKTLRDASLPRGQMVRMHMNFETKKTTVQKLTDNNKDYDFIKINPAKSGLPYCIYYAVEWYHDGKAMASMAIIKHDICKGEKTFWNQTDTYVNEPFFIANENSQDGHEDDGTLIFTANDGQKGKAIFVALDARTFTEIERIELPNHLSFMAHGQFIPATPDTVVMI